MAHCFCGCGRRLLIRGHLANAYGEDAGSFAAMVRELLNREMAADLFDRTPHELRALVGALERFRADYRDVVHGDRKLSEIDRADWVLCREEAASIRLLVDQRRRALGQWAINRGLSAEEAADAMLKAG
jgi:hypothetical protein